MPRLIRTWILAMLVLAPIASGALTLYRWQDADGTVNFSTRIPPGVEATAFKLREVRPPEPEPIDAGPTALEKLRMESDAIVKENCEIATENIRRMKTYLHIEAVDSEGRRRILDETEVRTKLSAAVENQAKYCE